MTMPQRPNFASARQAARRGLKYLGYLAAYHRFRKMIRHSGSRLGMSWEDRYPCLEDNASETPFDRHYVYHTAWAARILEKTRPPEHVDLSSCLRFVSIASAFVPIRHYDYRPPRIMLSGLTASHADLLRLPFEDRSIASLSCMHVVEHIGLGRYGDPLDPEGDLKAISELRRVLASGGNLLFAVPVGRPRIMFNAHRIYSHAQVMEYFPDLNLAEFSLVPDDHATGGLITNASGELADAQAYGCGCYWFTRT
ncbi:DUF268 domain-containing protein [bacterium]|nr:DUF268 domain-containing protein [bacterium]